MRSFHLKNIKKSILLAGSMLILSACASYDLNSMQETSVTIEDETNESVNKFNTLFDLETELFTTFESDIETDQELASFSNNEAEVFNNISTREETISSISDLNTNLKDHAEFLAGYDGDELNSKNTNALSTQLNELTELIDTYTTDYTTAIDNQTAYFESLGSNDATADTFIEGMEAINEEHEQILEQSTQINIALGETLSELESFKQDVEQALPEGE